MTLLEAIILGIVEGLTEFIPVSSTGHLVIVSKLLSIPQTEFVKTFEIFIQTGAILAVLPFFIRRVREQYSILINILIAFLPIAVAGVLLHNHIRSLLENDSVICLSMIIGGLIIILIENYRKKNPAKTSPAVNIKESFILGCFQALAIVPGVSRSGATIIGGLLRGINRVTIVEFSFLISVPTIAAAGAYDLMKVDLNLSGHEWFLLAVGFLTAWASAALCVRTFLQFISRYDFIPFGWYRIIAGLIFLALF